MPKYSEYPEALTISDNDIILILDAETNTTRRILASNLKNYFAVAASSGNASALILELSFNTDGSITDSKGKTVTSVGTASATNTRQYLGKNTLTLAGNSANYLSISSNLLNLNSTFDFRIEAAIFPTASATMTICSTIPGASNRGYNFAINDSRQLFFQSDGGSPTIQSSLTVPLNAWTIVSLSKRNTNYIFEVNNDVEIVPNASTWQSSTTNSFFVGRTPRNDFPFPFNGSIGALRMEYI